MSNKLQRQPSWLAEEILKKESNPENINTKKTDPNSISQLKDVSIKVDDTKTNPEILYGDPQVDDDGVRLVNNLASTRYLSSGETIESFHPLYVLTAGLAFGFFVMICLYFVPGFQLISPVTGLSVMFVFHTLGFVSWSGSKNSLSRKLGKIQGFLAISEVLVSVVILLMIFTVTVSLYGLIGFFFLLGCVFMFTIVGVLCGH